jgi:hypothetical protein
MDVSRVTHASWQYVAFRESPNVRDKWGMRSSEYGMQALRRMRYIWGWHFHFRSMGDIDLFDRLGARKHREWMKKGVTLSSRGESELCRWGEEVFGKWSDEEVWGCGAMRKRVKARSRCPTPAMAWVARVVGSKWWTDRMGLVHFTLRPKIIHVPHGAKRFFRKEEDECDKFIPPWGMNEVGFALELLREKKDSPIPVERFEAFARRFWGEKLAGEGMERVRVLGGKGLL